MAGGGSVASMLGGVLLGAAAATAVLLYYGNMLSAVDEDAKVNDRDRKLSSGNDATTTNSRIDDDDRGGSGHSSKVKEATDRESHRDAAGPDFKDQVRSVAAPTSQEAPQSEMQHVVGAIVENMPLVSARCVSLSTQNPRKPFRRKSSMAVMTAIRLDLEIECFTYQKWGGLQKCKPGDWLVTDNGYVYTVDNDYFLDNYRQVSPGRYEKYGVVWAEMTFEDGAFEAMTGTSSYSAGDYLVYDRQEGEGRRYPVRKHQFERLYQEIEGDVLEE